MPGYLNRNFQQMRKLVETYFFKATLFLIIFLNIYGAFEFFVPGMKKSLAFLISLPVSHFLAPGLKFIRDRGANRIQLKWMFLRKPISFNC